MVNQRRSKIENEVDDELIQKGQKVIHDFDEPRALHVRGHKSESKMISIRLPQSMIEALRQIAIGKGDIGYQQLIKMYVADRLSQDQRVMWAQEELKVSVQVNSSSGSSSLNGEFSQNSYVSSSMVCSVIG